MVAHTKHSAAEEENEEKLFPTVVQAALRLSLTEPFRACSFVSACNFILQK